MPAAADTAATNAITDELQTLGVPTALCATLLQAVDNAGYNVVPKAGGSAVAVGTSLAAATYSVEGLPGLKVVTVTMPDTSEVTRLLTEQEMRGGLGG